MTQEDVIRALYKLEEIVYECSENVPEWIMIATKNNEKARCQKEITDERYLVQQSDIGSFVVKFGNICRCRRE